MNARRLIGTLLALAALAAATSQTALAQLPIKPAATETTAKPSTPEPIEQQRARLRTQLEKVRADSARLAADPATAGAPAGLPQEELATARNALAQWALALDGQLRAIEESQTARSAREEAETSGRDWSGFAGPPPYSILLLDDLTEAVDSIKTRISALTAQRAIADAAVERAGRETQRSEAALRLAREPAPVGRAEDPRQQQWRVQVAEWSAAASAAQLALFRRGQEVVDEQLALEGERLKLAERKREVAGRNPRFSDEDLAQVRRNQDERRERIRVQRTKAAEYRDRQERELAAAAEALRKVEADATTPAEAASISRARVRASQAAVEAAKFELDTLDSLATVATATFDLYARRHQALNDSDAGRRRDALLWLREAGARIEPWRDYAQNQLDLLRAEERESVHSAHEDEPAQVQAYENVVAEAIRQRVGHAQRLFDAADRAQRTVTRWLDEIDSAQRVRPWPERLAGGWATVSDWARQIWNFELFAVEDTIDVGGQKITTSRGVTIGKSVGALLLFILGYWVAALLARRFERFLIGRFAMEPAQARTVRRWVLALWAFLLLVLTLNLARIPLTVFAFLGGALAIGVGFGTQTIIKNFISGLIVLMERQIRVGDTIEVDGVTGTVTELNLRSSTVRGFDGVEAIVPNSNLLENKVTNWTHTDNRVRRVVRIGVAYGSPVRKVADLFGECLQRHGLVLKDPEPQVLFEDFGDNALVFAMYFWLEMKPGVNSMQVMSDLRFMVHKRLDEEGIAVPFPQRDVHLDAARPLQVQVVQDRPAAGG